MKKILSFLFIILVFLFLNTTNIDAKHHSNFETINLSKGKLLENYTESEYDKHYKKVTKRKFFGWRTNKVNNRIKVDYVTETLFSYYNDGYTAIDYSYKLDEQVTKKFSISSTGSISTKHDKNGSKFKNGLNTSLKISTSYDVNKQKKETYDIKLKIDPGTQVDLYIYGEGRITNGVAAYYIFWIRSSLGGFEIFEVTTQYQRLEKKKI